MQAAALSFHDADIWTLYELFWLNDADLTQVAIGDVTLNATRVSLIEYKSFKLYVNRFNQTSFPSREEVRYRLAEDLSRCVDGKVAVTLRTLNESLSLPAARCWVLTASASTINLSASTFNNRGLDDSASGPWVNEMLVSHLLKYNYLITHQPDWGPMQIRYRAGAHRPRGAAALYVFFSSAQQGSMSSECNAFSAI